GERWGGGGRGGWVPGGVRGRLRERGGVGGAEKRHPRRNPAMAQRWSRNNGSRLRNAMDISGLGLFRMITQQLHWLGQRQDVLSQNVANADTPGYQARDLKPLSLPH